MALASQKLGNKFVKVLANHMHVRYWQVLVGNQAGSFHGHLIQSPLFYQAQLLVLLSVFNILSF
jgi:hypothetical protein